jgi:hypothetical protein
MLHRPRTSYSSNLSAQVNGWQRKSTGPNEVAGRAIVWLAAAVSDDFEGSKIMSNGVKLSELAASLHLDGRPRSSTIGALTG